ncbi:MAG: DUF1800 family protein [Cyanobacteriota bacterium]|nr:DUF1800 family protein [Cyanobacteriota bacterium]
MDASPSPVQTCAAEGDRTAKRRCKVRSATDLQSEWLDRLAFGPDQASARLVHVWTGIFPVSWRRLPHAWMLRTQLNTIEARLNGGFEQLLTAMVLDPALQVSLNGPSNQRARPNENLARELLELFSLGEGNYGEGDVKEAARALTGYQLDANGQLVLNPNRHDPGPKTILGRTAPFDGTSLAAWLASQPATARHITTRLWRALVGALPPASRIAAVAEGWRAQRLSLPWLYATLLNAPEAKAARGQRLEDPVLMMARSLALLGSRNRDALTIGRVQLARMGQPLLDPPSVKGWPVNEEWLNLRWLQGRRRGLALLLADEEVWADRQMPAQLGPSLTPIPPLELTLPAPADRNHLARLFADPVWQLA